MTNSNTANQRRLVVRVSRNSLSFSTTNGADVVYQLYPVSSGISIAANMREALRTVPMLSDEYQRVQVTVDSPVLMIPASQFDDRQQELCYYHAFTRQEQQTIMHAVLPDLHAVAVFSVWKDLCSVLADRFDDVRYMPAVASVWRHLHQRSFTGPRQKLYGYFHDHRLEAFSFVQNRFKFCNSYAVTNANDALYYLLAVWKQLGLEPGRDELHLCGDLPDGEELQAEAHRFIKRVFVINPTGEFNRAQVTQIPGIPYDLVTLYIKGR